MAIATSPLQPTSPPAPASAPRPVLHVLTGCTAVGKTEWALRWAEQNQAEIVSCDSLLFYRGMDIGTAKPTPAELRRVPHHLIDVCGVTEPMDITRYVALAQTAVQEIQRRGRRVLVTGGSGFYLKAFFGPVADTVEVPAALREEVAALKPEVALQRLRALHPDGLGTLDCANPRRVARALERCLATGRTLHELAANFAQLPGPFAGYTVRLTCLERTPEDLSTRVRQRVDAMLAAGLVAEVRTLLGMGLRTNPSAARAIGYRETIAMLEGALASEALADTIAQNTRALVKKQRTWFRTQLPTPRVLRAETATLESLFASE